MIGIVIYDIKKLENEETNTEVLNTETNNNKNNEVVENEEINEEQEPEEEYVGEEEKTSQEEEDTELSNDEKALQLAKEKWGEDDESVTYSIENKNGNIYHIAVKSNATTVIWYEVNIETWEISEFF